MSRLGLAVVFVVVFAVGACASTEAHGQARAEATKPDPAIARLLAARVTPAIVLPDPPPTPLGRCAIAIAPRPPETRDRVLAEFQARNGGGWRAHSLSFSDWGGTLRSILEPTDGTLSAPLVPLTDEQALSAALAFVVLNYDLFGFTADDIAHSRVIVGPQRDNGTFIVRSVQLNGEGPQHGYEQFASLTRRWNWEISFGRHGKIRTVAAHAELLPPFRLCTKPGLAANDAKVTREAIGYHLQYSDFGGTRRDAGAVTASDIKSISLTVYRGLSKGRDPITLRLAYEIQVTRDGLSWSFIVDADTGALIVVGQMFAT